MKTFKKLIALLFVGAFLTTVSTPFVFMFWDEIARVTFLISCSTMIITLAYTMISGEYNKAIPGGNAGGYKHL